MCPIKMTSTQRDLFRTFFFTFYYLCDIFATDVRNIPHRRLILWIKKKKLCQ